MPPGRLPAPTTKPGLAGTIYACARNKIEEPTHLHRLVRRVHAETRSALGLDVKGPIYEGLLERTETDVKSGAGQHFTPRPIIRACVEVADPKPKQTVCEPACGTGGFLLAAYEHMRAQPQAKGRASDRRLRETGFTRTDLVPGSRASPR